MPETPVDEHKYPMFWQNNVRTTWEASSSQAIAQSTCMEPMTNEEFQFRIGTTDP